MIRLITPGLIAFTSVVILSPLLITLLKQLELTQPIRKELPSDHQLKKGTPLMYGSIFFVGILLALFYLQTPTMLFLISTYLLFSFVGFIDDFWKASRQDPGGISGKTKLVLQFAFTVLLLFYLVYGQEINSTIDLYKNISLDLPTALYFAIITLFIVGSANAINFTDGLDGLLGVVSIPVYFFFFIISDRLEVKLFCLIMIGCLLGFLIFNIFPAKAFMGDTGSMAIGGSLSFLAVYEKVELLIPILFFIFFVEQLSVILQVLFFKLTGKRLFRFTPIHFHFRLKYNWSETMIVTVFGLISWLCIFICLVYWKFFLQITNRS
ncbi:phospho-N-acetylmuramoyl-pentapeptide-transferase [Pullulanibacillus sp. KACC 23026]|uniref:phospho-N-acetylmuramoyl-pentapeptide- transferase n=1 Tax=Pullulanibacillus sp. KACC 23026 TaxID=3028315 RepID=UPI0023B155D8|nr:phospho-N-acetylmuramoyl-pentapeptide-transferase [Pullulanibacillus sp. KACC 23026]WEG12591.1 phospho-N-acetylmuramoyl-pentapeptide-transferase [Pullulanibacillus sp. KACC 23026]